MDKSEYKNLLILIYFNTVQELYSYSDLMGFLSLNYKQLSDVLRKLIQDEFLDEDEIIKLSRKGLDLITELGLENVNFFELYTADSSVDQYTNDAMSIEDVYIPKNFDKKFKGY